MLYLSAALIIIFILSFWANQALARALPFNVRLFLLFPGVVIHELSHALVCFFSGTPVKEIKLFSAGGGYVAHEAPNSRITQFFISTAPLIFGILVIFFAFRMLEPAIQLTRIDLNPGWFTQNHAHLGNTLKAIICLPKNWFFLWLIISTILTFTPSAQDIQLALTGLATLVVITAVCSYNHWEFGAVNCLTNLVFGLALILATITALSYLIAVITKFIPKFK